MFDNIYLPLKWACSLHHEEPEITLLGFDGNGHIYVLGDCPYGHGVQVTIDNKELERLQQEAIRLIQARLSEEPLSEEEIERLAHDLDQMGIDWDELDDGV